MLSDTQRLIGQLNESLKEKEGPAAPFPSDQQGKAAQFKMGAGFRPTKAIFRSFSFLAQPAIFNFIPLMDEAAARSATFSMVAWNGSDTNRLRPVP